MRTLMVLGFTLLLPACVSFPRADVHQRECVPRQGEVDPRTVTRPTGDVVTKVIRFTEDGEFVSRCEYSDMLYELQSPGPQIVVMYVHGWKHNGDVNDPDLVKFSEQLHAIRSGEALRARPRRVVGVYVAWNGKRTTAPILKEFTFWGRKRAADRVSQSAAITKVLGAIDSSRAQHNEPDDLAVYVGHSFGARILYNAVSQGLIYRTELAHPGRSGKPYQLIHGFGDIVILLNPAFEASLFTTLASVRRDQYPFDPSQPPLLVSISSATDKATRVAFPLGQVLSGNRSPIRRQTLGNYEPYRTHHLFARSEATGALSHADCSAEVCLEKLTPEDENRVPFISVVADPSIMDGHNDVWNPRLVGFLTHLIENLQQGAKPAEVLSPAH